MTKPAPPQAFPPRVFLADVKENHECLLKKWGDEGEVEYISGPEVDAIVATKDKHMDYLRDKLHALEAENAKLKAAMQKSIDAFNKGAIVWAFTYFVEALHVRSEKGKE